MFIHYNETTNRVTGYVSFIADVPEVWNEPTIEVDEFTFLHRHTEYEIQNGIPVHVGKSPELIAEERLKAVLFATTLIDTAIKAELTKYNTEHGIQLASVHNAESYSRLVSYPHREFCEAIWLWSVELWEFMRAWQNSLTAIPTRDAILLKISEKPFLGIV